MSHSTPPDWQIPLHEDDSNSREAPYQELDTSDPDTYIHQSYDLIRECFARNDFALETIIALRESASKIIAREVEILQRAIKHGEDSPSIGRRLNRLLPYNKGVKTPVVPIEAMASGIAMWLIPVNEKVLPHLANEKMLLLTALKEETDYPPKEISTHIANTQAELDEIIDIQLKIERMHLPRD